MVSTRFGRPLNIAPRWTMVSRRAAGTPSTVTAAPPKATTLRPVAVTTMSAGSVAPEVRRIPSGRKRSMVSVTIEADPREMALKRSPSGTTQTRWSHGP